MANTYSNTPVLSKVKIGTEVYWLKDADVRALLDTYGDAVKYNVDTAVTDNGTGLITSGAVHAYVTDYVTEITGGAMTFIGIFAREEGKTDLEILTDKVPAPAAGFVAIVGTAEYVYANDAWHLYGDEGIYATVAGVDAEYVKQTLTIAGINLKDAITVGELQAALGLDEFAYKNSASGTVTDYATGINGAAYTPAGSVAVTLNHTSTTMNAAGTFTPAGTVSGNVTAAGTVSIARDDENGTAVSGTVSAPTITITPATTQVQHINSVGTLPSYTAAQYTAPSVAETSAQFASEGIVATYVNKTTEDASEDEKECLVFSSASTANALTATGFNAGSYTAAEFNAGALPTLGATQTVVTGIEKAEASAPTFAGDKFGATFAGSQVSIAADFAGTEGNISVSGNYDKAGVESAAFTGTEATITPELVVGNKTITVQ